MPSPTDMRPIIERLAERLKDDDVRDRALLAEEACVQPQTAVATTQQPGSSPKEKPAHIDLLRLQRAGMVTPKGGRGRVLDEYRLIKRPILRNAGPVAGTVEKRRNLVMVTSARPGEGKTFTCISLAMSVVAEQGTQVLLVDLDLKRQQLCQLLGIRSDKGLMQLLHDKAPDLADVLVPTDVPGLTVLPAGADHPLAHELLAGPMMGSLMDIVSTRYRGGLVIFDTAPALVSSDPSVLATSVGQVLLVVEAHQTNRASVEEAVSMLDSCKLVSIILNKVAASELRNEYGSYYDERFAG